MLKSSEKSGIMGATRGSVQILFIESYYAITDFTIFTVLKAASITLPHSTLDRGVYDMSGAFYPLPKYVVCE